MLVAISTVYPEIEDIAGAANGQTLSAIDDA